MLKKRLIGVIVVKNDLAVQSLGYNKYLPLGKPEFLAENLDRWGADEILIQVIDRSINNSGPDFNLLKKISRLNLSTPLIYGGGINSVEDGVKVVKLGADRILFDTMFQENLSAVKELGFQLGKQALIASMPISLNLNTLEFLNYKSKTKKFIDKLFFSTPAFELISEVMLSDFNGDGYSNAFHIDLINFIKMIKAPLILFGGISNTQQLNKLLAKENVSAVAIGNFLNYQENAIQKLKENADYKVLRRPFYSDAIF